MRGSAEVAGAAFDGWSREAEGEGWAGAGAGAGAETTNGAAEGEACVRSSSCEGMSSAARLGFLQEVPRPVSQYRSC